MLENNIVQKKYYNKVFEKGYNFRDANIPESNGYFVELFLDSVIGPDSKKVLEIGCGNGLLTFFLLKRKIQITAVDISEKAIECMKEQFAGEIEKGNLKIKCADILEFLKNSDEKYDAIVGSGIIHHIEKKDWKILFQLVRGRLSSGGIFACGPEPNASGLYALAWPFARFFYRIFGMDFDWEVEKGTLDMIPIKLKSSLKEAGFCETEIMPFQTIPHFHSSILKYIDTKAIKYIKGKWSFYIIVKGKKK